MKYNQGQQKTTEWWLLLTDPWLCSLVTWLFPAISLIVYAIFSQGLARDLPIGIVDLDHSRLSRTMARYYDASPTLAVNHVYTSPAEGIGAMRSGEIYGLIIFPADMERNTIRGNPPQVDGYYNSQFLLIGKLVKSAMFQAHATAIAGIEVLKNLSSNIMVVGQAMAAAVPVSSQTTPLFNSNSNYAQFLLCAIIPAIWQIFIVVTTVLTIAKELRREGLATWLSPNPLAALIKKLAPCTLFFWLHGMLFLLAISIVGWPMHGDPGFLVFCQLLTVLGCQAMGALIFFLSRDPARSLGLAAAYSAPGLAFMGVTFPATDMTLPARIWRSLLPVSHYIDIQIAQINYGVPPSQARPLIENLLLFFIPAVLTLLLAVRTMNSAPAAGEAGT
ncbi:ABC transporter permease [Desulfomarina sp.]